MPVPRITKEELKQRLDSPETAPTLLDARLKYPYEHSAVKLPGAIRVAPSALEISGIPRDREVVAYDSDPDELNSERLAVELIRKGYQVSVLKGGINDWMTAKLPVESKSWPQPAATAGAGPKG
jgi:ArsR family transcriptional regulator